jgi:hypothetical protein
MNKMVAFILEGKIYETYLEFDIIYQYLTDFLYYMRNIDEMQLLTE